MGKHSGRVVVAGLVGLLVILLSQPRKPLDPNWCKTSAEMKYWQSPMPWQMYHRVYTHTASALRDGCFDGRRWTSDEINKTLSFE